MSSLFETLKANSKNLPNEPGCYLMKDSKGKIFYIGKAQNLKARIKSYFTGQDKRVFVSWLKHILADIETIVVRNNTESLILEHNLIRKHQPKFNILLKDGKNFILLRLDNKKHGSNDAKHIKYPRLEIVRQAKKDGARYFGPYPSAGQLRQTLHLINKHFQLRNCNDKVIDNRNRPCIQYQIGRCPAPCIKEIPGYESEISNVISFLMGQTKIIEKRLAERMWHASQNESYELAAQIRNQLNSIKTSLTSQVAQHAGKNANLDVFAVARTGPLLEIAQLFVREGRVIKNNQFSFDDQEFPSSELLLSFISQLYEKTETEQLPKQILTAIPLGADSVSLATVLSERKAAKITIKCPIKGKSRHLIDIAQKNAQKTLETRLELKALRTNSLNRLKKLLDLDFLPQNIECFDVSLFQGTDAVASQICFTDGQPDKKRYRKYNIKTVEGTNDFAMLKEVLTRRLKKGILENNLPDLLIVDGGKGQLSVALSVCQDLNIEINKNSFYVAAIAKARTQTDSKSKTVPIDQGEIFTEIKSSYERLFVPNVKDPILLKAHTAEKHLIERIRDEAHRFAVTTHRNKRKKRTLRSQLEDIPGLGKKRITALLKHIGSLENVINAKADEIAQTPGISKKLAQQIHDFIRSGS